MEMCGEWRLFDDGAARPVMWARIERPAQDAIEVPLVVDTGADSTVFSAHVLPFLADLSMPPSESLRIMGIGGGVEYRLLRTPLLFMGDTGQSVTVNGEFAIVTDLGASDLSVLGRDVLDNFAVIVDRPGNRVLLLSGRHRYTVSSWTGRRGQWSNGAME